jgi:hypothetical protein
MPKTGRRSQPVEEIGPSQIARRDVISVEGCRESVGLGSLYRRFRGRGTIPVEHPAPALSPGSLAATYSIWLAPRPRWIRL